MSQNISRQSHGVRFYFGLAGRAGIWDRFSELKKNNETRRKINNIINYFIQPETWPIQFFSNLGAKHLTNATKKILEKTHLRDAISIQKMLKVATWVESKARNQAQNKPSSLPLLHFFHTVWIVNCRYLHIMSRDCKEILEFLQNMHEEISRLEAIYIQNANLVHHQTEKITNKTAELFKTGVNSLCDKVHSLLSPEELKKQKEVSSTIIPSDSSFLCGPKIRKTGQWINEHLHSTKNQLKHLIFKVFNAVKAYFISLSFVKNNSQKVRKVLEKWAETTKKIVSPVYVKAMQITQPHREEFNNATKKFKQEACEKMTVATESLRENMIKGTDSLKDNTCKVIHQGTDAIGTASKNIIFNRLHSYIDQNEKELRYEAIKRVVDIAGPPTFNVVLRWSFRGASLGIPYYYLGPYLPSEFFQYFPYLVAAGGIGGIFLWAKCITPTLKGFYEDYTEDYNPDITPAMEVKNIIQYASQPENISEFFDKLKSFSNKKITNIANNF